MAEAQLLREAWLNLAVTELAPLIEQHGYPVPRVHVTCGWPSQNARPSKRQRIGECWTGTVAEDGLNQIFISPMLGTDVVRVLDVTLHELVHAAVGTEAGHKGPFVKVARALGLRGKATATYAGEELEGTLREIAARLPAYPHSALKLVPKDRKQTTRMIRATCTRCTAVIRLTRKWIEEASEGLYCPVCQEPEMLVA
jgi:hypothetical protein